MYGMQVQHGAVRLSSHHGTKRCVYVRVRSFWSVVMMIRIRGENESRGNGSRGNGRSRRGRKRGGGGRRDVVERGGGSDFLYERAYLPSRFPSDPVLRCIQISPKRDCGCASRTVPV